MAYQQRPNEDLRTDSTTDEYGNPVAGHGGTTGAGYAGGLGGQQGGQHPTTGIGGGGYGTGGLGTEQHGQRRTGSDSSSSSEDDGEGGRRKKGLTEKIKEKLPGGKGRAGKTEAAEAQQQQMYSSPTTAPGGESKGMMEKIKEKLPGGHHP